jgi:hypothetical protein
MDTLMKGREVEILLADGTSDKVTVRQLPLGEYREAMKISDDEMKIVALVCGKHADWINKLDPEGYEALRKVCWEVNEKGFFAYYDRQVGITMQRMNQLSPEVVKAATGASSQLQAGSPVSVPRPQSPNRKP